MKYYSSSRTFQNQFAQKRSGPLSIILQNTDFYDEMSQDGLRRIGLSSKPIGIKAGSSHTMISIVLAAQQTSHYW